MKDWGVCLLPVLVNDAVSYSHITLCVRIVVIKRLNTQGDRNRWKGLKYVYYSYLFGSIYLVELCLMDWLWQEIGHDYAVLWCFIIDKWLLDQWSKIFKRKSNTIHSTKMEENTAIKLIISLAFTFLFIYSCFMMIEKKEKRKKYSYSCQSILPSLFLFSVQGH